MAVGIVEFTDKGSFADRAQLPSVVECIRASRQRNPNGVVVVAFAHGWHHNASWDVEHNAGDVHFAAFRRILTSLVLREAERNQQARRVIGIYIGWRGKTSEGLLSSITEHFTLWSRLRTAERIGRSQELKQAISGIVEATKGDLLSVSDTLGSPLIIAGHSMGALMVETAFLSILQTNPDSLLRSRIPHPSSCATVRRGARAVSFPDLILLLNAATGSRIAKDMKDRLAQERLERHVQCGSFRYTAPVVVSVTSEADDATKVLFPLARPGQKTEGHDAAMQTHSFRKAPGGAMCSPKPDEHIMADFNQSWHCLREPKAEDGKLTSMAIDLPQPLELRRDWCHVRYRLAPLAGRTASPFWIFQVPRDVMGGHSDIFNDRSSLFVMALSQMAGGVMSLADKWTNVFEVEEGQCRLRS